MGRPNFGPLPGLAGKNRWEKAKVDEILELHKSEYNEIMEWIMVTTGFKEGDKDRLFHTMAKPVCEHYFNIYHRILKENGSGFLVGKKPTAADFFVADYLHTLHNLKPELFEKHLDLVGFVKRIYSLPQLKAYIEKRPETPL
uniref:glutathione transferase n=1 Tax=Bursaphelenchus xylophilus TaxID=6326 RepID=A0A1I7SNY4_BURXY